jgi:hypothetical protein
MDAEDLIVLGLALVKEVERLYTEKNVVRLYEQAFANVTGKDIEDVTPEERALTKHVSFGTRMSVGATLDGMRFDPEQVQGLLCAWEKAYPQLAQFGVEVGKGKVTKLRREL